MELTGVQQHLLSYFQLVHVASHEDATSVYEQAAESLNVGALNVHEEIYKINQIIKQYDFEIVKCTDEITCEKLYIMVNTVNDKTAQRAKFYDKTSTNFFSQILKDCIASDKGNVTETHCLNLSTNVGMTKTAAQNVLNQFIKDKWLVSKDGSISLGMRTIIELEQSIKQLYPNNALCCPLCNLFIVQGFDCENCKERYHYACMRRYVSGKASVSCFKCKVPWSDLPEQFNMTQEQGNEAIEAVEQSVPGPIPKRRKHT